MEKYLALRIIAGKMDYETVKKKFPQYIYGIEEILKENGFDFTGE